MPTFLTILKVAFAAYLTYDFVRNLRNPTTRRVYLSFQRAGVVGILKVIALSIPVIVAVVGVAVALITYWPQVMGFSWLQLFAQKGEHESGGNLVVSGALKFPIFGLIFMILFMLNVPRLARYEEDQFRRGTKDWKDASGRSIRFGLMHCIVGVPVGVGLALAIGGMWFTYQYFKGGVRRSTLYHSIYNMIFVVIIFISLAREIG